MADHPTITYRRVPQADILPLRQAVIIAGTNRTSPDFPGDHDDTTRHFAALDGESVVGCASFMANPWKGEPAWQLRGMATAPAYRGTGIGTGLLAYAEAFLRDENVTRRLWCNARVSAVSFYEQHGWQAVTDVFEIEGVGPHRKMTKSL